MKSTTVVIGGTGKTGRRVSKGLTAREAQGRIGSREAEPSFDWQDPDTWAPALRNVGAAYVTFYPDLAVPEAAATVGPFAELAVSRGVRRLALRSGRGEQGDAHAGQLYELTGPRLLTFAEAIAEIAGAAGREIRHVEVSTDQYASLLAENDVSAGPDVSDHA